MQFLIRNMGNHAEINESEIKVNATGKTITYNGTKWFRKDVVDRVRQCLLDEHEVNRELKTTLEGLIVLLDQHGINDWKLEVDF